MTGASKCYYSESKMGEVHLECSSGFTLSEGTCQPNDAASCPEGTYYDGENSSC